MFFVSTVRPFNLKGRTKGLSAFEQTYPMILLSENSYSCRNCTQCLFYHLLHLSFDYIRTGVVLGYFRTAYKSLRLSTTAIVGLRGTLKNRACLNGEKPFSILTMKRTYIFDEKRIGKITSPEFNIFATF